MMAARKTAERPANDAAQDFYLFGDEQSGKLERTIEAMQAVSELCYSGSAPDADDLITSRRNMGSLFAHFADAITQLVGIDAVGFARVGPDDIIKPCRAAGGMVQ
jgi:hypothetical protein